MSLGSRRRTNTYTLYWLTGKREVVKGDSVAYAMILAGYGRGALGALDFFTNGDDHSYEWNSEKHTWESKREEAIRG